MRTFNRCLGSVAEGASFTYQCDPARCHTVPPVVLGENACKAFGVFGLAVTLITKKMPLIVDFILPRRPLSHQARGVFDNKRAWRDYVFGRAMQAWPSKPLVGYPLKFTMVYLSDEPTPGDINNFVKPVQDALCAYIYADDSMIKDVSAHLRLLSEPHAIGGLPDKLARAIIAGVECVYVAISDSSELIEELK